MPVRKSDPTDAAALLQRLASGGVEFSVEGERLRYSAPRGVLTPEWRSLIADHKQALLTLLRPNRAPAKSAERSDPPVMEQLAGIDDVLFDPPPEAHPFRRHVAPVRAYLLAYFGLDKDYVRGEGSYLVDRDGRRYLDFIAQYGALPFGYNPPAIWEAIEAIRREGAPPFAQNSLLGAAGQLAEKLLALAPRGLRYANFANSGAEAVEAAIKLCRAATGRAAVLATRGGFHGLTLAAASASGSRFYQQPFGLPLAGFAHVPFGDGAALEQALAERPDHYAAFIVEPIQGEGGIVPAPPGYLAAAQRACRRYGVAFVVDEVQTGLGRTGRLFACEDEGIEPDALVLAKALGGGLIPVGACLYRRELHTPDFELRHGSTFGGGALACRAGLATLDLLTREDGAMLAAVRRNGAFLRGGILELRDRHAELVCDVRGRGFMLGVDLALGNVAAKGWLRELQQRGMLVHWIISHLLNVGGVRIAPALSTEPVLRVEPPLTANDSECRLFLDGLDRTLRALKAGTPGLLGHLVSVDAEAMALRAPAVARAEQRVEDVGAADPAATRFAFVTHVLSEEDVLTFDPSLSALSPEQSGALRRRLLEPLGPLPARTVRIASPSGAKAWGEIIFVPYTAAEFMAMPLAQSLACVRKAGALAAKRGARVIGLGGFTSIVSDSGLALGDIDGAVLTTGNSLTAASACRAVVDACAREGRDLACSSVAIIGAAGNIGSALAVSLAPRAGRLILAGNPRSADLGRTRLRATQTLVLARLRQLAAERGLVPGSVGTRLAGLDGAADLEALAQAHSAAGGLLELSLDPEAGLPGADVVVVATSAVDAFVTARHLCSGALVCDISRPRNVDRALPRQRPDVSLIEGGLIRLPHGNHLDLPGADAPDVTVACLAETILLALEGAKRIDGLCGALSPDSMAWLERAAMRHGFAVVSEPVAGGASTTGERSRLDV
jgi:acetylornithine/succinyldiaminopimelate/putrescine aminotransferase/predicted amino acid dehydrogenase